MASVWEPAATIAASVDPNGLDTSYAGQYGPDGYGTEITPVDIGAGTAPIPITVDLAHLSPGTTYTVLLVAANSAGTTKASALTLHTNGTPPPTTTTTTTTPPPKPPRGAPRFVRVHVAGLTSGGLSGVSCSGTSLCVAVGSAGTEPTVRPVVDRWRGDRWRKVPASGAGSARLLGVSCPSRTRCFAVGNSGAGTVLALRWNGRRWLRETPPVPPASGFSTLESVTCVAVSDCWAVGLVHGGTPNAAGVIEHWNGRAWTLAHALARIPGNLTGVACAGRDDCWAVGVGLGNVTLAEHWSGRSWSAVRLPRVLATTPSVACPSRSSCWIGTDAGSGLIRLVGRAWHKVGLPVGAAVEAISCSSARDCWASGFSQVTADRLDAFATHWNGRHWTTARTVNAGKSSDLSGIACPTDALCLAVGGKLAERVRPSR